MGEEYAFTIVEGEPYPEDFRVRWRYCETCQRDVLPTRASVSIDEDEGVEIAAWECCRCGSTLLTFKVILLGRWRREWQT
jgi:hypothetical protein